MYVGCNAWYSIFSVVFEAPRVFHRAGSVFPDSRTDKVGPAILCGERMDDDATLDSAEALAVSRQLFTLLGLSRAWEQARRAAHSS